MIRKWPDSNNLAVFHQGRVTDYFPFAALKLLQQVDVDLMRVEGIINEDRRVVFARLFGFARKYGLHHDEISALMSLPSEELARKMERVLNFEQEGSATVMDNV